jgi:cupin fold WbuC family metalloprotein
MFLITIDKSGRLLVEQSVARANGGSQPLLNLPTFSDGSSSSVISNWLNENGVGETSDIAFFDVHLSTRRAPSKYAICNIGVARLSSQRFVFKSLDEIWKQEINLALAVAMNQIVKQVENNSPGVVSRLEHLMLQENDLKKVNPRVFFARSETVVADESLISFLGAFAVANGHKTARLCMHHDQSQVIQEMLMIHAEKISTGPLRQDRDSSVSYHMIRGALEITLHHGGVTGDKTYQIEHLHGEPSVVTSLRVPARVFRTIRTLTDSAVFIEVQSGPFSDSDTQWAK